MAAADPDHDGTLTVDEYLAVVEQRFDAAVTNLNLAITGSDAAAVADAFGELSEAAGELADAVAREGAAPPTTRSGTQGAA